MAGILEYSSDRTSNTTINGIGIAGSDSVKHGNDAIQQLMADLRTAVTKITDKGAGSYTAVKADHNQCWRVTGTATINLTAAATLTAGWCLWVMADGATATIDPAGSEKINGGDTLALSDGNAALIICTATDFRAIIFNAPFDASTLLPKSGGTMTGGLDFGSAVASSATDLTRHIALYTAQYGFTVTASNLNYISAHSHSFYSGTNLRGKLDNAGNWTVSGKVTVGAGPTAAMDAATKQYVDALPITKEYVSAEQSITTTGSFTLSHGLGTTPKIIEFRLVCKTAEGGYEIGDEVRWSGSEYVGSTVTEGPSLVVTSSQIVGKWGNTAPVIVNKTTGASLIVTPANWRLVVRAYA